jgi:hypothetical protein
MALVGQSALAQAEPEWTAVSANVNGTQFYAHDHELAAARTLGANPTVWVKQNPSAAQAVAWSEGHALYQINCARQTYQILEVSLYYPDGSNQSHRGEGVTRQVVPQTPLHELVTRVCPAAPGQPLASNIHGGSERSDL